MKLSLSLATIVLSSTIAFAAPATLATVNGKTITTNDANAFTSKAMGGVKYDKLDAKLKRQVVEQLVNQELIKTEVTKSGIQNTAAFKNQYAALKNDLAVDMWMKQQMGKISVSDAEAEKFYNDNKDKMKSGDKTVPFEAAKKEIVQFLKLEKFKAHMGKTTEALRKSAKVEIKVP